MLVDYVNYLNFSKKNKFHKKITKCIFGKIQKLTVSYQHGTVLGEKLYGDTVGVKTRFNIGEIR